MKLPIIFLVLFLLVGCALGASAPLKSSIATPIASNVGTDPNVIAWGAIQVIPAAESTDDDQIATGVPANNTTDISITHTNTTLQPDVPRNIIVTPSGAATGYLWINGTDANGETIASNLTLSGAGVVATTYAFKTVDSYRGHFTQETARTLKIGTGDLLGLNMKLRFNSVLLTLVNGVKESAAPTVATSATILAANTIDTGTAPGGHETEVYFLVPDPS